MCLLKASDYSFIFTIINNHTSIEAPPVTKMSFNYIVTANKASAVSNSVSGNFTGPDDINLITAKLSRLEISRVTPDGLKFVRDFGVFGRIESIKLFRPPGYDKDLLFLLTNKYHVAILECIEGQQAESIDIITVRSGNVADPASRPSECGNIVIIDPTCKMIALRMHDGLFKVIPFDKDKTGELEAFNIRMEEIIVPDIAFLHGFRNPTIGFIYKDQTGTSNIKTYEIALKEKEFVLGPWQKDDVSNKANIIIPVPEPFGGAIIISLVSIVYINSGIERTVAPDMMKQAPISCYTRIDKDGSRYLLGDVSGRLFCLVLEANDVRLDNNKLEVKDMKLEYLGEVSSPECLTYLDNAIVYVGSKLGDSQLVKLLTEPDDNGNYIQVCETYTNLGPIVDMCLVDLEKQGQGQLVTCSGHAKDGTIRIIRNGIGINEHSALDHEGVKAVWALKLGPDQKKDNHILITLKKDQIEDENYSYLWHCEDDGEFDNITSGHGFETKQQTMLCANVAFDQVIQVSQYSVRLINAINKELVDIWKLEDTQGVWAPGSEHGLFNAACNQNYVACAESDTLYSFAIEAGKLVRMDDKKFEAQIACLDLTPLIPELQLLSVGFWPTAENSDLGVMSVVLYTWPQLEEVHRERLHCDFQPGSIVTAEFEDVYYLLVAHRDGTVFYFKLDPKTGHLSNCKKVTLGTHHTVLRPFKSQSTTSIFACSDRPTVIYSSNKKLVFSNVNLKEVNDMCSLNSSFYPDSLALVSNAEVSFGTIDEIQKLHIRTIPLYESPICIAYQQSTQTFGLLTSRTDIADINGPLPIRSSASTQAQSKSSAAAMSAGTRPPPAVSDTRELDTSSLLIIDQHTFEVLHSHQFLSTEMAMSILSARIGEAHEEYFIVGTALINGDEPEAKSGRLAVFKWSQKSGLQQIAEAPIRGSPYCLHDFDNGKFLAGINASVNLVELNSRGDLHIECSYTTAVIALFLKRKGDLILMGDLMRSLSLYTYKPLETHFEEVAKDLNPSWMTDIEILDDETFLGAEHQFNIFVSKRDSKASSEQERAVLNPVGLFHLGDAINVFHPGSLVVQHPSESSIEVNKATLFGTIEGVIGLILTIDEELYKKLDAVQTSLVKVVKSLGKIDHVEWRSFHSNKSSQQAMGFIDGDLVETFLDLSRDKMEFIAKETNIPTDELVRIVEEFSRLH